jgi:UDP-2,3-diacylglucosamine hydrolase
VERSLALICGAGTLPARMAAEAKRQGWRVVAFTFGDAGGVGPHVERVVPSRVTELAPLLSTLRDERVSAAVFSGKFSVGDIVRDVPQTADGTARALAEQAGSLRDVDLASAAHALFQGIGIEVLDPRPFLGEWLPPAGCWTARPPTEAEWMDVQRGLTVARMLADAHVGQTVIVKRGVVVAVETVEGTTDAIRRGARQGGADTVIVKAVARDHDYRFDTPAIGPETLRAAAEGKTAVVAIEAGRVMLVERETTLRLADAASIALVSVDGDAR